jgi:SlyX protein
MRPPSAEDRLIELESRLMHQDALLEQLNAVVVEQQVALDRLQREVALLREQILQGPAADEEGEHVPFSG